MIRNCFKEEEIPYEVLETFGLTREMVEDLPLCVLQQISNGHRSPVLPIHVKDNQGNIIKSRTRFSLIRNEDGKVDVLFYPQLQQSNLSQFSEDKRNKLLSGKAIIDEMPTSKGNEMTAFHQIDAGTGQVLFVPTPVIGRNLQLITDEFHLSNAELNCLKNGEVLTITLGEEQLTMGIDLNDQLESVSVTVMNKNGVSRANVNGASITSAVSAAGLWTRKGISTMCMRTTIPKRCGMS